MIASARSAPLRSAQRARHDHPRSRSSRATRPIAREARDRLRSGGRTHLQDAASSPMLSRRACSCHRFRSLVLDNILFTTFAISLALLPCRAPFASQRLKHLLLPRIPPECDEFLAPCRARCRRAARISTQPTLFARSFIPYPPESTSPPFVSGRPVQSMSHGNPLAHTVCHGPMTPA